MLRRTGRTVLGWLLTIVGIVALVLPGPGLLLTLAGVALLSQEYEWAERRVEPLKQRAYAVARAGASTYWRIAASGALALALIAAGVVWGLDPVVPTVWFLGRHLPLSGWTTGSSVILSGLVALGVLAYSVVTFGPSRAAQPRVQQ